MAFHHRKLSQEKNSDDVLNKDKPCYICYFCNEDCRSYFSPPPPPPLSDISSPSDKHHISIFLILVLSIMGALFFFLFYLTIRRHRSRNSIRRSDDSNFPSSRTEDFLEGPVVDRSIWCIRSTGLPQSVIDSIPAFSYKKDKSMNEGGDCSVCLSEFEENERLRLLPNCSHVFHLPCIDTWLRSHKNCPVCRATVSNVVLNSETGLNSSGSEVENVIRNEPEPETDGMRGVDLVENNNNTAMIPVEDNDKAAEMSCNFDGRTGRIRVDRKSMRRSVSMDLESGSRIYYKKAEGFSEKNLEERGSVSLHGLMKSSSFGRSVLQMKGPVSMKRSVSLSGKKYFRKHSRSQESVQISELRLQIN